MTDTPRIRIASLNTLNLRLPGRPIYQLPVYTDAEYAQKCAWLGRTLDALTSDLVGVQEVFDEAALHDAAARRAGPPPRWIVAPAPRAATDLPRVGLLSWLDALDEAESVDRLPDGFALQVPGAPELGIAASTHDRFSRPVLRVTVDLGSARRGATLPARVYVVHLKSRRPKWLDAEEAAGSRDDPVAEARAHLRSLLVRAAEAGGLRALLLRDRERARMPLIVLGDFNDHAKAATTNLVAGRMGPLTAANQDVRLHHATALAMPHALTHRLGLTKYHLGEPDSIDHILLSGQFVRGAPDAVAEVERVDYFNDHLAGPGRLASDHGAIRATLRLLRRAPSA